jgi:hypothetical protein
MTTSRVDVQLRGEAQKYRLRFGCEDCAHFAPDSRSCSNGFPAAPHLGVDLERTESIEFCKAFELA